MASLDAERTASASPQYNLASEDDAADLGEDIMTTHWELSISDRKLSQARIQARVAS